MPQERNNAAIVWSVLGAASLTDVPDDLLPKEDVGRRSFQLLEVVVARMMSVLFPRYTWCVSPQGGDGGIDFQGERVLVDHRELGIRAVDRMTGQCSRQSDKIEQKLFWDAGRMAEAVKPSHFIFVVVGQVSRQRREGFVEKVERQWLRPVLWLGPEELHALLAEYWNAIEPIVRPVLSKAKFALIADYVSEAPELGSMRVVRASCPATGRTGEPFSVDVVLSVPTGRSGRIRWRWASPLVQDHGRSEGLAGSLQLIRPALAAHRDGDALVAIEQPSVRLRLVLVGHSVGPQPVGTLELLGSSGEVTEAVPLGEIDLADAWTPPFYRRPFEPCLRQLRRVAELSESGRPCVVAVVGAGGAGKTRLCTEHMRDSERRGSWSVSVFHECSLRSPYAVFGALLARLCEELAGETDDRFKRVVDYLSSRSPELVDPIAASRTALFESLYDDSSTDGPPIDTDAVLSAICIALVERASLAPQTIHIGDLHWLSAHASILVVDLIARLREIGRHRHLPVMVLLEGRRGEVLPELDPQDIPISGADSSPWEGLIDASCDEKVVVEAMDIEVSRGLVELIFENSETPYRRVQTELLENQSDLMESILEHSRGNPFHILEHVKLLGDLGFLERNRLTGRFYLTKPLDRRYRPTSSVVGLIRARLEYLYERKPRLVKLLAALAFVRNRVPTGLFEQLRSSLAPDISTTEVLASQFVILEGGPTAPLSFEHEHYFRIAHTLDLQRDETDQIVECYLKWFDSIGTRNPQAMVDRGFTLLRSGSADRNEVWDVLEAAAERSARLGLHALAKTATDLIVASAGPLSASDSHLTSEVEVRLLRLSLANAEYTRWTAEWNAAAERYCVILRRVETIADQEGARFNEAQLADIQHIGYSAAAELADVDLARMRHAESVGRLQWMIPEIRREAQAAQNSPDARRWWTVLIRAINRMGVLLWFDGQLDQAAEPLLSALRLAQEVGTPFDQYYTLVDYATWLAHDDEETAEDSLHRAQHMVDRLAADAPLREVYLVAFQLNMVRLRRLSRRKLGARRGDLKNIADNMVRTYDLSRRGSYNYEMAGSALVAGVAYALLGSSDAGSWFLRATDAALRSGNLATLWISSANLAQWSLEKGAPEAAAHHADRALKVIGDALKANATGSVDRERTLYSVPLAQIFRVYRRSSPHQAEALELRYEHVKAWSDKMGVGGPLPRSDCRSPLLVRCGGADYFLMA